ncbi:alpha-amylase family glycosyl hydrolase [Rahnella sp. CJA17(1/100)]|uniref:alpha-amylase family glycosyl hydrolase n=1 Tax=Rahnella sp. CJA17(1/100) TaxID=2508951 RepID=UPI00106F9BEB|nr:alpha-amylase family glycosyl hydrolase [Rahnella sp. CJA17(1/100)]
MDAIQGLLKQIYAGKLSAVFLDDLITRIEVARNQITYTAKQGWDEKDVVLITYADQFTNKAEKTLSVFDSFYQQHLADVFNIVHLLPFYPYSSDDGFSVIDYQQVNPLAGNWKDIRKLGQSSRLMFDYVCNHISASSEWFKQYLAGNPKYENYFISLNENSDLSAVTRPRRSPLLTPFRCENGETRHVWTTFSADQIDLNFAHPDVLRDMLDVLLKYLSEGAEYVRLDAVGYMWKEPGTSCIHLPKTHLLVKLFRAVVEYVSPGTVIITETNVPHQDNISYFGNGFDEAQMVYQFPLPPLVLHAIHSENGETLKRWAAGLDACTSATTFFNFLASHDGIGLNPLRGLLPESEILRLVDALQQEGARVSYKNNPDGSTSPYEVNVTYMDALNRQSDDDDIRLQRFMLAHAILLAFPGVPAVYIQSILGSRNDIQGVENAGYNRAINRQKYDVTEIGQILSEPDSLRARVFGELKKLIICRTEQTAFHPSAPMRVIECHESVFAFIRGQGNQEIVCLFNLSANNIQVTLPSGNYQVLPSNYSLKCDGEITLKPYQYIWLRH